MAPVARPGPAGATLCRPASHRLELAFLLSDFADDRYGVVKVRGWTTMKLGLAAEPTDVRVPLESLAVR